jgi:hypothetical protein
MANQKIGFDVVGTSNAAEVMGKAGKEADKLANKIKKAFNFKTAIIESVLAGFGAAALIDKTISTITEGISKLATVQQEAAKAGIDPGEFDKLATVADKSGVSMQTLGSAIRQLKVGMKDALTDTDKMTKFTKGLGFAEADLRSGKVKTIDVFTRIGMAMQNETNESTKLAIATAFLSDKFGTQLLPTLQKIADNPDIFKGMNAQAEEAYNAADRAMEKWSKLGKIVGEGLAIATMDILENPIAPGYVPPITEDEQNAIDKKTEQNSTKVSDEVAAQINADLQKAGITTGLMPINPTNVKAITDAENKSKKDSNTIANSLGASMGNGPTSGVIGVGNNAVNLIMEEQLDTLKQIKDGIDRLAPAAAVDTDFTKTREQLTY